MREKLIIIGNGMAPGRMLEHLLEAAPERYDITIFNAEPRVNYDRIMLSPVLSGEKAFEEIVIHGDGWYIERDITLYKGHKVVAIDRAAKTVTSEHGETVAYDRLVIATGSVPFIIPVPGKDLPGSDLSRPRRRQRDAARCPVPRQGGGDRRRAARARSGGGTQGARHGCHRAPCHADSDGTPA
jgi:NAD(P)H-nitrite reductase large subunit